MPSVGEGLAITLRPYCALNQKVVWHDGHWRSFEGTWAARFDDHSLEELAYAFDYRIVLNCQAAGVLVPKEHDIPALPR